jgi:ammonium transporter, Amt family
LNYHSFFFQWAFVATAATIVSGSVAERCKLEAYFIYSFILSAFIFPVVVCWCWGYGFLSPFGADTSNYLFNGAKSNNFVDFAGSGVVHMVGGFSGLMAAIILGPRTVCSI